MTTPQRQQRTPFIGEDNKIHYLPPRKVRSSSPQHGPKGSGVSAERQSRSPAEKRPRSARNLLAIGVLAAAGAAVAAFVHVSGKGASNEDMRPNRENTSAVTGEPAGVENGEIRTKQVDLQNGALILAPGAKIYHDSDAKDAPAYMLDGVGIVEQPERVQLGQDEDYAVWYRFSITGTSGEQTQFGMVPASSVDEQQMGFVYNLDGDTGTEDGVLNLETNMFRRTNDGKNVAELKTYDTVVAANTALAQNYVLPLPITPQASN